MAVTGAAFPVTLNGEPQAMWTSFAVNQGDELAIGNVSATLFLITCSNGVPAKSCAGEIGSIDVLLSESVLRRVVV